MLLFYLKTPSSFWWLDVYADNRSSEEQISIFKHQYLLKLHNLWQNRFLLCGVQMGITIFRSDIKAYSYSFSPVIEAYFETSVSLLETGLKSIQVFFKRITKKKKVDFHSLQSFFDLAQHVRNFFLEREQEGKNVLSCLLLTLKNPPLVTCCMYVKSWSQTALGTQPLEMRHHAVGLPAHWA